MSKIVNYIQKIRVIAETDEKTFENKVNELLNEKYTIISSSCGFVDSHQYDFCNVYQAILLNPNIEVKEV